MMKFIVSMQINIEIFYKLTISFWVCVIRLAQSIQNKNFAYLCNISRKAWEIKLIFCLQITAKVFNKLIVHFGLHKQACLKYPEQEVYNVLMSTMFAISHGKREGRMYVYTVLFFVSMK